MKLLFFLLITSSVCCQVNWESGDLHLKTGEVISSQINIDEPLFRFLAIKDSLSGKKKKYTYKEVQKIVLHYDNDYVCKYKIIKGSGRGPKLLHQVSEGNVSLYAQISTKYDIDPIFPNEMVSRSNPRKVLRVFYYGINNSDIVEPFPKKKIDAIKLFNDCPDLVVKYKVIDKKDFDIPSFIEDYNSFCDTP